MNAIMGRKRKQKEAKETGASCEIAILSKLFLHAAAHGLATPYKLVISLHHRLSSDIRCVRVRAPEYGIALEGDGVPDWGAYTPVFVTIFTGSCCRT